MREKSMIAGVQQQWNGINERGNEFLRIYFFFVLLDLEPCQCFVYRIVQDGRNPQNITINKSMITYEQWTVLSLGIMVINYEINSSETGFDYEM